MMKPLRLMLIALAGAAGLALAATALPSSSGPSPLYTPELIVEQSSYKPDAATRVGFLLFADPAKLATAKIAIFSPSGYKRTLTQAPGTKIGKVFAQVRAQALGGANLKLTGNVVVGDPADPSLQAAANQCTGSSHSKAIWLLNTKLQGQSLQIPDFVNVVGPYVEQQICLLPPASAPLQAQLWEADFTVNGIFTNGPGTSAYYWASDLTPYSGTTPDTFHWIEYRTWVPLSSSLTFKRVKSKKSSQVAFSGKLVLGHLAPPAGVRLHLYRAKTAKPAPDFTMPSLAGVQGQGTFTQTPPLNSKGMFSIVRLKPKKHKLFFQMRFEGYVYNSGCAGPSPSGLPIACVAAALPPLSSKQIAVAPAKKT
ncbi:MAG: hypothetical protein ACXVFC_00515 [Gaiellaceae bacterium]